MTVSNSPSGTRNPVQYQDGEPQGTRSSHRITQALVGAINVLTIAGFVYQITTVPHRQLLAGTLILIGLLAACSFWLPKPVRGVITFSLAGLVIAMGIAVYLRATPVGEPPRVVVSPSPVVLTPTDAKIIGPLDGFRASETRLSVTVSAPAPASGHQWYVTVQPSGWSNVFFEPVIRTGPGIYTARAGIGPAGAKGSGSYVLSLVDVTDADARTIVAYKRANDTLYGKEGMASPAGVRVVHTITVQR
jgi:hypothetical protein